MKYFIGSLFILLVTLLCLTGTVFAATSQDVVITADPAYISITNAPATWTLNGITGTGKISTNTTYYSNPLGDIIAPSATVADAECRFTLTNPATVNMTLTVTCSDFTGGSATMTNSNVGTNGATDFGGYSWYSGLAYANKVVMKTAGSAILHADLYPLTNVKWGAEIRTRTNAWTGAVVSTSNMTITAAAL